MVGRRAEQEEDIQLSAGGEALSSDNGLPINLRALAVNVSFFAVGGPGEEDKSSDVLSAMVLGK